jgi:hypothetical protein
VGDLLNLDYARSLLAAHRAGTADHSRKVWAVVMFCLWHAVTVEGAVQPWLPAQTTRSSADNVLTTRSPDTPHSAARWQPFPSQAS